MAGPLAPNALCRYGSVYNYRVLPRYPFPREVVMLNYRTVQNDLARHGIVLSSNAKHIRRYTLKTLGRPIYSCESLPDAYATAWLWISEIQLNGACGRATCKRTGEECPRIERRDDWRNPIAINQDDPAPNESDEDYNRRTNHGAF
jgi:hypothetical protein